MDILSLFAKPNIQPFDIEALKLNLFGKDEKKEKIIYSPTFSPKKQISVLNVKETQETISPSYTYAPHIIISSPYASTSESIEKKTEQTTPIRFSPMIIEKKKISDKENEKSFDSTGITLIAIGIGAMLILPKIMKKR